MTLNAGPGWTGCGGPWVKPEQSMQHIVAAAVEIAGPSRFDAVLPRPARRPAFFGEGGLPPEIKTTMNDFYRDVAVLAFPTPAGGPLIADIDEKALYVRAPYSSQPGVKPFLPSPGDFPAIPAGAAVDPARIIDLTDKLAADGRLAWDVPGRPLDDPALRPDEHRRQHAPGPGPRPGPRMRQVRSGRPRRPLRRFRRSASPRDRPAPDRWASGLDDAPHRQLGDGRPELDGRVPRGIPATPRLRPAAATCRRSRAASVEASEISERFLWDLRQTARSWSSKTTPSISRRSDAGTASACRSSPTT